MKTAPEPTDERVTDVHFAGNIHLHRDFHSSVLDNDRNIWVYLPPSYTRGRRRYAVLYLQDGQNMFNPKTAFAGVEWQMDETAEQLIAEGKIEEIIMVAVSNTPDRMAEYTHVPDPEYGGGNLEAYARFLKTELKPYIDRHYRTRTEPSHTGILGSSLGGLSALYLGWYHGDTFGLVGAVSPSLWWAERDLTRRLAKDPRRIGPDKIWLDMGTREGSDYIPDLEVTRAVLDAREMLRVLLGDKGYVFGHDIYYLEVPTGLHSELYWQHRMHVVLMALFGKRARPRPLRKAQ